MGFGFGLNSGFLSGPSEAAQGRLQRRRGARRVGLRLHGGHADGVVVALGLEEVDERRAALARRRRTRSYDLGRLGHERLLVAAGALRGLVVGDPGGRHVGRGLDAHLVELRLGLLARGLRGEDLAVKWSQRGRGRERPTPTVLASAGGLRSYWTLAVTSGIALAPLEPDVCIGLADAGLRGRDVRAASRSAPPRGPAGMRRIHWSEGVGERRRARGRGLAEQDLEGHDGRLCHGPLGVGVELVLVGGDLELRLVRGREVARLEAVRRDVGLAAQLGGRVVRTSASLERRQRRGVGLGDGLEEEAPGVVALELGGVDPGRGRVADQPALADDWKSWLSEAMLS
jgi:hypothetical protein